MSQVCIFGENDSVQFPPKGEKGAIIKLVEYGEHNTYIDVTDIFQSFFDRQQSGGYLDSHFSMNSLFTDPLGGVVKKLKIYYDLKGDNSKSGKKTGPAVEYISQKTFNGKSFEQVSNKKVKQSDKFSYSFSMNLTQGPTGNWRNIFHKGSNDQERSLAVWLHGGDTRLHCRITTLNNANDGFDSQGQISLNTPTHVVLTVTKNQYCLYLDGKLDTTLDLSASVKLNNGPLYIGKNPWYNGFVGDLSHFRIYPWILSHDQIKMDASSTQPIQNLIVEQVSKIGKDLLKMYEDQVDTDVTIVVEGTKFNVHRLILRSRSAFFGNAFSMNLKESQDSIFDLKELKSKFVEILIKFMYSGTLFASKLDGEELVDLLMHADFLQIDIGMEIMEFIDALVCDENVCAIMAKSYKVSCKEVINLCTDYIVDSFKKIAGSEKFLTLPIECIAIVLQKYAKEK